LAPYPDKVNKNNIIATTISEGQRSILSIIAALTGCTTSIPVRDGLVVEYSEDHIPAQEVHNYINQLQGLGYITTGVKKQASSGADFIRLINMTKEGLRTICTNQELR
jgi:hypothetical protein